MAVLNMRRHSDDNEYLHRDFHASIDNAIAYIGDNFGEDAVREYLAQYVGNRFRPMDLPGLKEYFESIYRAEHAENELSAELTGSYLKICIASCPGIGYFNSIGSEPSKWYKTTTTVLYDELAKLCGLDFELGFYDEKTGRAEFEFRKKVNGV